MIETTGKYDALDGNIIEMGVLVGDNRTRLKNGKTRRESR